LKSPAERDLQENLVDARCLQALIQAARAAARSLVEMNPPSRPERIGSPWALPNEDVITFVKGHHDHIHFSCGP
jgi:hypothetical protein